MSTPQQAQVLHDPMQQIVQKHNAFYRQNIANGSEPAIVKSQRSSSAYDSSVESIKNAWKQVHADQDPNNTDIQCYTKQLQRFELSYGQAISDVWKHYKQRSNAIQSSNVSTCQKVKGTLGNFFLTLIRTLVAIVKSTFSKDSIGNINNKAFSFICKLLVSLILFPIFLVMTLIMAPIVGMGIAASFGLGRLVKLAHDNPKAFITLALLITAALAISVVLGLVNAGIIFTPFLMNTYVFIGATAGLAIAGVINFLIFKAIADKAQKNCDERRGDAAEKVRKEHTPSQNGSQVNETTPLRPKDEDEADLEEKAVPAFGVAASTPMTPNAQVILPKEYFAEINAQWHKVSELVKNFKSQGINLGSLIAEILKAFINTIKIAFTQIGKKDPIGKVHTPFVRVLFKIIISLLTAIGSIVSFASTILLIPALFLVLIAILAIKKIKENKFAAIVLLLLLFAAIIAASLCAAGIIPATIALSSQLLYLIVCGISGLVLLCGIISMAYKKKKTSKVKHLSTQNSTASSQVTIANANSEKDAHEQEDDTNSLENTHQEKSNSPPQSSAQKKQQPLKDPYEQTLDDLYDPFLQTSFM